MRTAKLAFISHDDSATHVVVPLGVSIMQAAVDHGVDGIIGECGGKMVCATCHVFVVDGAWPNGGVPGPIEDEMLDFTATPRATNSRLGCQLIVTEACDGATLGIPATQMM